MEKRARNYVQCGGNGIIVRLRTSVPSIKALSSTGWSRSNWSICLKIVVALLLQVVWSIKRCSTSKEFSRNLNELDWHSRRKVTAIRSRVFSWNRASQVNLLSPNFATFLCLAVTALLGCQLCSYKLQNNSFEVEYILWKLVTSGPPCISK